MDRARRQAARPAARPRGSASTTSPRSRRCAPTAASSTSPAGSPRPWRPTCSTRPRRPGYKGLFTRRDPARDYPARDVAANLVGFLGTPDPEEGARPLAGFELHVRQAALRQRRLGALPGQRRQPDPARCQHHREGRRRRGPAHHHRPRPAVVRPAGAPPDGGGRPGRVRHRDRDGLAHRRAARAGRPPDVRRHQAARRVARGPRLAGDERRLRARLGREGADHVVAHRRRQGDAAHQAARAAPAVPPGPPDQGLVRPRHDQPDPGRRAGQVVQHRHRAGGRPDEPGRPEPLPALVRPRPQDRHRGARRDRRHHPGRSAADLADQGPDGLRAVPVGQRGADDGGHQHHRQRRGAGLPERHLGSGHHRRRRHGGHRHRRAPGR